MVFFYTPAPFFSLFLVHSLLDFIAFMVRKLLLKYLEIAWLHLDTEFLGSAILFTTSLLTQSSTGCQRQQCQAWLILSKHPKLHLLPKHLFWRRESINNKALQAHRCDLLLLSMQEGYLIRGIQMTSQRTSPFPWSLPPGAEACCCSVWGWAGAAQAWSSLQK